MPAGANVRDTALDKFQSDLVRFRQEAELAYRNAITAANNAVTEFTSNVGYWNGEVARLQQLAAMGQMVSPQLMRAQENLRQAQASLSEVSNATSRYQLEGHRLLELTQSVQPQAVAFLRKKATTIREYAVIQPVPGSTVSSFEVNTTAGTVPTNDMTVRATVWARGMKDAEIRDPIGFQKRIAKLNEEEYKSREEIPLVGDALKMEGKMEEILTGRDHLDFRTHFDINNARRVSRLSAAGSLGLDVVLGYLTDFAGEKLGAYAVKNVSKDLARWGLGNEHSILQWSLNHGVGAAADKTREKFGEYLEGPTGQPYPPDQVKYNPIFDRDVNRVLFGMPPDVPANKARLIMVPRD